MIYVPQHFRVTDQATLVEFMRTYDFATIVSRSGDGLTASHLPVLCRTTESGLVIAGHMARANPHWRLMDGATSALAMFHGPHGYVSPTWYATAPAVPTWNYGVVHAEGRPKARDDENFLRGVLEELVGPYEQDRPGGWQPAQLPEEYYGRMQRAIIAFEMPVVRLDGKFKLGQNRSADDRRGMLAGLEREDSPEAAWLAEFTRLRAGV